MRQHTDSPPASPCSGFPSPARDHAERTLDLNSLLVRNPAATYFVRVEGSGMASEGIFHGDLLVVDRSAAPRPGHVVVAAVDGGFLVRRIERRGARLALASGGPGEAEIPLDGETGAEIWGVALHVIHGLTRCSTR